jgi:MraZ protein
VLRGQSPATIDDKGRLKIPSLFRALLQEEGTEVYVTSLLGDCVWIYTMPAWNAIEEKFDALPPTLPARNRYLNRVNYFGQVAEIDKQGRVLIHPLLRDLAAMSGEVAVVGQRDHLEVWNHERLKAKLEREPMTDEVMEQIAEYMRDARRT